MYGDIDDNNSTSSFANRERLSHTYFINGITLDFHHIRAWNGTFYYDWMPNNANSNNKRRREKKTNSQAEHAHIFIIITFAK